MTLEELAGAPNASAGAPRIARQVSGLGGVKRFALAVGCGACAALSLPPLNLWPALILALALVLWLLDGIAERPQTRSKVWAAFLTGWCFGFGYFVLSLYWIGFAFLVEADIFAVLLPLGVAGLPAYLALYWGLAAGTAILVWRPGTLERVLAFALAMAAAEWLRGHLLTGFPWNAPGYAAAAFDGLAQLAAYVGLPGLTLLVVVWAGAAVVLIETLLAPRRDFPRLGLAGTLLLTAPLAWAAGAARIPGDAAPVVPGLRLRIVQANIPQSDKWRADRREEVLQTYFDLSSLDNGATAANFTHLVWPESALPALVDENPEIRARLAGLLPPGGLLLLGALRRELPTGGRSDDADVYNSILVLDEAGRIPARYDKWRLVPFGEFLPWADVLEPLGLRKLVPLPGSFRAGPGPRTLHPPATPAVAPLVCYEAIFPNALVDPADRPQWLLNLTNDGWFGISAGPYQHLEQARFRAIEQGLPLVRAANTGISAVFDPYGRAIAKLPLGEAGSIDSGLPEPPNATIYARYGDAIFFALLAIGAMLMLAARFTHRRVRLAKSR